MKFGSCDDSPSSLVYMLYHKWCDQKIFLMESATTIFLEYSNEDYYQREFSQGKMTYFDKRKKVL